MCSQHSWFTFSNIHNAHKAETDKRAQTFFVLIKMASLICLKDVFSICFLSSCSYETTFHEIFTKFVCAIKINKLLYLIRTHLIRIDIYSNWCQLYELKPINWCLYCINKSTYMWIRIFFFFFWLKSSLSYHNLALTLQFLASTTNSFRVF